MQKRRVGATDIYSSVLGLGTVKFGRNQNVKYPFPFELPTNHALAKLLDLAADLGINLLDTAPAYGSSEERLGLLLQSKRNDWLIVTKAGEEFADGKSYYDFSASAITKSLERSLNRLKTDYIDILLIHSSGEDEKIINECQVFLTLEKLKQAGKIRAYGMSTKTVQGGLLTIANADVAMVTYNLHEVSDKKVLEFAAEKNKGIFIKKALASGHLNLLGNDPINESLQFILKEKSVSNIIIGTINPEHLQKNVAAADHCFSTLK